MHAAKLKPNQKEQNFIDYIVKSKWNCKGLMKTILQTMKLQVF
jgi:hypothetical protein